MVAFLPDPAVWPFAAGESPFRIKGTAYRGHLEYVESQVPGGVARMIASFDDTRLAKFFEQPFLAASFYDVFPLVMAALPCAAAMGVTPNDFVTRRSRAQAPKDLTGVYRFLLAMVPTRSVAKRMVQLFTQILDFGKAEVVRDAPGEIDTTLDGIPAALTPWLGAVISAYGEAALRTSGAKRASITAHPGVFSRSEHGVTLTRSLVEVRWG